MNTFKINKDNIIYKNYIIRFYEKKNSSKSTIQKKFRIISYKQALPDLHDHISRDISTSQYLIDGNWAPHRDTACGLLPYPFKVDYVNKKDGLIKAKTLIDEILKHEKIESSYYWFFISLAHMSDIIDEGYINTSISKNYLKRSIDYLHVDKIKMLSPFLNKMLDMENAVSNYTKEQA